MTGRQDEATPEGVNREQLDEGQANDVADDARAGLGHLSESRPGGHENPAQILPDDVPDLVDRMNEMVRTGRIDNDAYAGEPSHDDEEDILGETESAEDEALDAIADTGDDPLADLLADVAGSYGLEDETGLDDRLDEDDDR